MKILFVLLSLSISAFSEPMTSPREVEYYKSSAEKGVLLGMVGLASCYYYGDGMAQDHVEAAKWSQKAIDQAKLADLAAISQLVWDCYHILGQSYLKGRGVKKDVANAVVLFKKAAEEGCSFCQCALGECYFSGIGVPKDGVMSYMWLNLAAAEGDPVTMKMRDSAGSKLSSDQLAEAQRLCREWKPKKSGR